MKIERKLPALPKRPVSETGHLAGIIERAFFTIAIATGMGGTAVAMVAWITVRNRILWPGFTRKSPSAQGTVSLLTSIPSMLMAILGAEVCRGRIL